MNDLVNFSARAEILQCPICADIIQSKHLHQLVYCQCGNIFTDSGNDYERYGWGTQEPTILKKFEDTND